jgi:ubiquinone/menaquinone biosynthesis C-methylase UbiE
MMLPSWLIKLGFHLLYYQMAWSYDWVAWSVSFGQWPAWRRLALQFLQPGPILELAYGTGGLLLDMNNAGYQPMGIDLSPHMARLAGQRLRRNHIALRLNQAKAQALPFPSDYFANVVATFPTNYIFAPETLAEVYRVLKAPQVESGIAAGRLIIVVEGQLRGPWPIRPAIDWLYDVTGQKSFPPARALPVFAKHHLSARWEIVDEQGVSARLLIADKLSSEQN